MLTEKGLCPHCPEKDEEEEECEEGYEKNEEGECVKMEEEEDSLPYEDGDAVSFTLTPVTDKGEVKLDPRTVIRRFEEISRS